MPSAKTSARLRIAHNIRKHRLALAISQEGLAELADLHRTYIGSVERGERNITIDSIERLAGALGVSIEQLLVEIR